MNERICPVCRCCLGMTSTCGFCIANSHHSDAVKQELFRQAFETLTNTHSGFRRWIVDTFIQTGGRLRIGRINYPMVLTHEQTLSLIEHLNSILPMLPTNDEILREVAEACKEQGSKT